MTDIAPVTKTADPVSESVCDCPAVWDGLETERARRASTSDSQRDPQAAGDRGTGPSILSPFAEPFLPRDVNQSVALTLASLTPSEKDGLLSCPSADQGDGAGQRGVETTAKLTSQHALPSPASWPLLSESDGSGTDEPISRSAYLWPVAAGAGSVPVGFERQQRRREQSRDSPALPPADPEDEQECCERPAPCGDYSPLSAVPQWAARSEGGDGSIDLLDPASVLPDLPILLPHWPARRDESRLLSRVQQPSASTDGGSHGSKDELGMQSLRRSVSCDVDISEDGSRIREGRLRRIVSLPELGQECADVADTPSSQRSLTSSPTTSTSADSEAQGEDSLVASPEESEREKASTDGDGDTTLIAECIIDDNGNIVQDHGSEKDDDVVDFDANGNLIEVKSRLVRMKSNLTGGNRAMRSSADSGLGSLSEQPTSDWGMLGGRESVAAGDAWPESGGAQRPCPVHADNVISMYCADCCQVLCAACLAHDHMDCCRVLTLGLAVRDVRWQLLKMQAAVGAQVHGLEAMARQLAPQLVGVAKRREQARGQAEEQLQQLIAELRGRHEAVMAEVERDLVARESQTAEDLRGVKISLLLLNYVGELVEVVRQRDSGLELLHTYDRRLSRTLTQVVSTVAARLHDGSAPHGDTHSHYDTHPQHNDLAGQRTALSLALDVLDKDLSDDDFDKKRMSSTSSSPSSLAHSDGSLSSTTFRDDFYASEWNKLNSDSSSIRGSSGNSDGDADSVAHEMTFQDGLVPQRGDEDETALMREIVSYMQRFPPPSTARVGSSLPSLYADMIDQAGVPSPTDLIDEVFHYDEPQQQTDSSPADVFTSMLLTQDSARYKVQLRMCPAFPEDAERPFVTDLHMTETGQLVFLDAANHSLKRVDLRRPSSVPVSVPVSKPLALCSAGWDRVMVSCDERVMGVYHVGGPHVRAVTSRVTRLQYRGLVRASDALVAAACPESRSVDLLDLGGRVLRSIMPVDFVRGPEVVGCTRHGELLVVHQPATPPTTLLCFDMAGHVIWEHKMRPRTRHVSCCKVIGGADGHVYYALQGDSAVYRLCVETGQETVLLNSTCGIKFPSSLAVDKQGRVLVTRSELSGMTAGVAGGRPTLPITTEVDMFQPDPAPSHRDVSG